MLNFYYSFGTSSYAVSYLNFWVYPTKLKLSIFLITNSKVYHPFKYILILNCTNFFIVTLSLRTASSIKP